ncbi:hypothetical protein N7492_009555 [Penicillium capsulatum]|uniref:Uncharacterized protein n=1 Tax=Penicillium capsulatum TaxID=69766 RepID=A0A9W9HSZ9_9EURO|nr:hypothetical protein N7492_009555 [Penicillium capsulatum]KAJ6106943.1 hypothetical protein N7512_010460 [Penicillium capsulatum]
MPSQVWLVTGTSSGLGNEFVRAAVARGDKVIATARNADKIAHLKELGVVTMQLDVTAPQDELDRKAEEAIAAYGRIDVLVNNAGYLQIGTVEESSHDVWFNQFNTNLFGTLNVTRSFLPHLRANRSGTIVFIGSKGAWESIPTVGTYCASKAAIHSAAQSLSAEIAPFGIKTLLVEPGTVRTEVFSQQNMKTVPMKYEDYRGALGTLTGVFDGVYGNELGDARRSVENILNVVKGENGTAGKEWPSSLLLGSDAVEVIRKKCQDVLRQVDEWEALSKSTDV